MTKEKQNERFDGGVEGLFRYHRSLHLLLCCLLTPLLAANLHLFWVPPGAGPMPFADFISSLILITAWLFSGQYFIIVMAELILYASDGSPTEKAARWRSALWDRIKIDLGFWAGVVALLSLLHALAGGLKPNFDLPLLKSFLFITFGFYPLVKIALADKHGIGLRWWMLGVLFYFILCYQTKMLGGPLTLLPHALGLTLLLLGLVLRRQPLRSHLLANAFEAIFAASLFMWLVLMVETGMLFDWQAAVAMASVSTIATLVNHERIRRGLFSTNPEIIASKMFMVMKKRLMRLFNPLDASPWYWRWVRLVLRLAPYAWLIALISSIVAVSARLATL